METEDLVRARLAKLIAIRKTDLKTVSLAIGKNHAYLHQYLTQNKPQQLPEGMRFRLARVLGAHPRELGAEIFRPSYLDLFLFPLRCQAPQCGADFSIAVRGLISRDTINCPTCAAVVDLKKLKPAIHDLARVATELDKMTDQPE